MMNKLWSLLLILTLPGAGYSGDFSKVGTAAAQFLKIGIGARAMGMGETFVAVANDGSSLYWNPSGLTNISSLTVSVSHSQWFAELYHNYAGVAVPLGDNSVIGISVISLSTNEQEVTTVEQPDGTGLFYSVNDIAIGLSYARTLTDRFSVGMTAKYVQQDAYNVSANTIALDIGTYLRTGYHNLIIGMCVTNFGGNMQLEGRDLIALADINKQISGEYNPDSRLKTEPWPLPLNFRVGIAMNLVGGEDPFFESESHQLLLAMDANHPNDNSERFNIGGEYSWSKTLFARFGYKINYDVEKWSIGTGFKLQLGTQQVQFDYAFVDYQDLGKVSRFSVELGF